jgi:methionyl aminopeptidase
MIVQNNDELNILREGGRRLANILQEVANKIKPGISTGELDSFARELIGKYGDDPAFLGYRSEGARIPYPAALCVSVNEEVVHGIPSDRILKEGDIVSLDCGLKHKGLYTDHAITVPVGKISKELEKLLQTTKEALYVGIQEAVVGNHVGDIGYAIENFVKPHKYGIVRILSGHGVGKKIHEDPYVPNFGKKGSGMKLSAGLVIAIEPMLNLGSEHVVLEKDGYTYSTIDERPSAHFEHTVVVGENEAEILTRLR